MRVVGIDQSYTGFGYCVDGEAKKKSFPSSKFDSEVERLSYISDWFETWLGLQSTAGIDLVVMEGYANNAKFGREIAGELGAVVKLAVYSVTGTTPLIVPPNSLKKFVIGKAVSGKNVMLMHVYKQWGVEFADDNQADAYALEKFGHAYLNDPPPTLKYQIEAIEAVTKVN